MRALMIGVAFVWAASLGACHESSRPIGPSVGSETHWLSTCETDAECGEINACVCGICTAPCEGAVCGAGATCLAAGTAGADALCGALPATAAGLCAAACAGGCPAGQTCAADGICVPGSDALATRRVTQPTSPAGAHAIDILFVVDDTREMCQEQAELTSAFAEVIDRFDGVDYRIAVITTDMSDPERQGAFNFRAAPPAADPSCLDAEGQPWVPQTDGCEGFLGQIDDPKLVRPGVVPDDELAKWFRCIATVGTRGDVYRAGFGALWRALSCDGPNAYRFEGCCGEDGFERGCPGGAENSFLRPGADLLVVVVSDANDCTDSTQAPRLATPICQDATDADDDGLPDVYAVMCPDDAEGCYREDCGDLNPEACAARCVIARDELAACEWQRDGLIDPYKLAFNLTELKADRSQVAVWSFVAGDRFTSTGQPLRYDAGEPAAMCDPASPAFEPEAIDACCPEGRCLGLPQLACEPSTGGAYAGYRYTELADGTAHGCSPENGCGLCGGGGFAERVDTLPSLRHGACLSASPACVVADGDRFRSCETDAERADAAHYPLRVELSCPDESCPSQPLTPESWRLEPGDACESKLLFRLVDPAAVPAGRVVRLIYGA